MVYNTDVEEVRKMIYTVTFNPSLDYILSVKDFQMGRTNRTRQEQLLPGGKGINVSTVLTNLGIENTALGFTAGFSAEAGGSPGGQERFYPSGRGLFPH